VAHAALVVEQRVGGQQLADDLGRREVAIQAHGAGETERAAIAAAHLRAQAQRDPAVVRHQHRADPPFIGQPEHELAAAVLGRRHPLDVRQRDVVRLRQPRPEVFRQIGHRLQVDGCFAIDPRRQLAPAIARGAERHGKVFELGRKEANQIGARHRRKDITATGERVFHRMCD